MSLGRKLNNIRHSLAFRLTLWYAGIFLVTSCVAFLFFYLLITTVIRERTDQDLLEEVRILVSIRESRGIEDWLTFFRLDRGTDAGPWRHELSLPGSEGGGWEAGGDQVPGTRICYESEVANPIPT